MRFLREEWRKGLALVAALLFLVQTLAGASALAAGSNRVALDAFGNPLCITGVVHGAPDSGGDHGKMPGCCMLGCGVASCLAQSPETASLEIRFSNDFRAFVPKVHDVFAPRDEYHPASPRAPPASI